MSVRLHEGDCLAVMQGMEDNSVDSIVTDPPYGLSEHSTEAVVACLTAWIAGKEYVHTKTGFMGRSWDAWTPGPEVWRECLRVLKPGGHMLAFAGTRSMDLMSMAIRLAGFELRDNIGFAHDGAPLLAWAYGQGMPKGQDIAKAMTKAEHGSPQGTSDPSSPNHGKYKGGCSEDNPSGRGFGAGAGAYMKESGVKDDRPLCETAKAYSGWHTSLKPAWEPIIIARKPCEGTVVQNTLKHGTGGLNIDACRLPIDPEIDDPRLGGKGTWETGAMAKTVYGDFAGETVGSSELGRFPSNVVTDGSEMIEDIFSGFGEKTSGVPGKRRKAHETHSMSGRLSILDRTETGYGDAGSASRFFYQAKATAADRDGSKHVSVKPIALMRYLCKLVTPKGGIVLDPFAGSGTTGQAAIDEGFKAILIEREAEYCADIRARLVLFLEE